MVLSTVFKNAIYIYNVDGSEYYIDATDWTKMYSKDEIYTTLAKDSWVSKDIIKNSKKGFEDSDSIDDGVIEMSYSDINTQDVVSIYLFIDKWTTYTYKVRNLANEKICFSKMTFPHQLIRVFLLEQIYRGFKISKNETYHW